MIVIGEKSSLTQRKLCTLDRALTHWLTYLCYEIKKLKPRPEHRFQWLFPLGGLHSTPEDLTNILP